MEAPLSHDHDDGSSYEEEPLKIYSIPYLASGHMNPHCEIARLFASRGHHVTIITTPSNANMIRNSIPQHPNFHVHTIPFPSQEVGLPDGVESLSAISDVANMGKVSKGIVLLREPMERFVEQHPPDCIIADFIFDWVEDLATRLRIPRLAFNGFCLFAICAIREPLHPQEAEASSSCSCFVLEGLPHRLTLRAQPPSFWKGLIESKLDVQARSHGLIINNFAELDGEEYIQHYEQTTGHKVWHLGPAPLLHVRTEAEKAERGQRSAVSVHECMTWLDSKPENSVLYICFGSLCQLPDKQLYEIACAVEASGCGFIWVVPEKKGKEDESEEEKDKWLPKGFEERMENKGMIVRGWAPQVLVLGHPAVGAFLTHCGWNSTVEAVSAGVPVITWPVHGEQFYNEKLISEVRGIGVEVGAEEWTNNGLGVREKLVGRESIEKAVRTLMDGGDEAGEIRRRAQDLGNKAKGAVQEGGSSYENLTALIDHLKRLRDSGEEVINPSVKHKLLSPNY